MYFTLQYIRLRVCLKKAFCKIYISCFAKSIFQTRSKKSYISEILNVFLFQKYI